MATSDADWLFESVQQFLSSPSWALPVMSFIDENCIVFDLDDENKLVYMEIYQAFKDMVDSLLEFHLSDMGVTQEQFFAALASNPRTILAKQLLEQLLVIDDFLSFKKMMVKRNAELEAEALGMIKSYADSTPAGKVESMSSEGFGLDEANAYELQLERAMKLSMEEARDIKIDASEIERLHRAQEQAELEMVLAMSLRLEDAGDKTVEMDPQLLQALEASKLEAEVAQARRKAEVEREAAVIAESNELVVVKAQQDAVAVAAATAAAAAQKEAAAQEAAAKDAEKVFGAKFGSAAAQAVAPDPFADEKALAAAIKEARQQAADAAAYDAKYEPGNVLPAESPATRAVASLAAGPWAQQRLFVADPANTSEAQRAQLKRAEEATERAAEARKREQQKRMLAAVPGRQAPAGVALSASMPTNAQMDTEIEVQKRAEHMRRQRELLLLQKRNQAIAAVNSNAGAGYMSAGQGSGAGGQVQAQYQFLADQRKELEQRMNKDEAEKKAELERIQKQKASFNAMLLKGLM
mmetsp:Transcript_25215/g.64064  ORF Transcript_25215/g.64064 Transcript_25215/m.64064 type:complete len:525 (-) Transcript_25215:225-1799(-)|eukprot:CAMPEP_0179894552 /NCGR_PEP_ID=MMETSP0982-20121206/35348_1 /TAXON_ID=483367 /ORGANISM="non described non described, Strain CCMP 2436" /LENGTH=524 /DNA_ID=CAMNT_0021791153 /DNA_START=143 /DNA_END=1717 /DNA_ORIENTATION=-